MKNPIVKNLTLAIIFGLLSLLFGLLQFNIPGVGGGVSDLREIPLVVCVFYIGNPIYLIISSFITALATDHPPKNRTVN